MKFDIRSIVIPASIASLLFLSACDWSSGSQDNFNTSGGSTNVNISGFYRGNNSGGRAVANTSNGNITSFTIQQSGNRVQVFDNQGSVYEGSLGTPLLNGTAGETLAAGATFASYQISFSGKDNVASRDINFTGVLTIVTVSNIQSNDSDSETEFEQDTDTTEPIDNGTVTTDASNSSSSSSSSSYTLTESNNQLLLQGTWSEVGGVNSSVRAVGPPVQGTAVLGDGGTGG